MTLNEILKIMDKNNSVWSIVNLMVFPNKKYILVPYFSNHFERNYKNRGSINFSLEGNFETDSKDEFYSKMAQCIEKCICLDGKIPELESDVKKTLILAKFEKEYIKNIGTGYHMLSINFIRRLPDWKVPNEENQKLIGNFTVTESFPYFKSRSWAGRYNYIINKSNIEKYLYDDIIEIISKNNSSPIYADKNNPKTEPIHQ